VKEGGPSVEKDGGEIEREKTKELDRLERVNNSGEEK
jgi:hypothetical protein